MAYNLAPIVLFVYNRPWHTRQAVESLQLNILAEESKLFIFSDGPKNPNDSKSVEEVREYLKSINGFAEINIFERKNNLGLANSVIIGVSDIISRFGKVIVLEDDIITSPYFLSFMNESLHKYENEERVISIHAYVYPNIKVVTDIFFVKGADCWAWATWKRGWDLFEPDGSILLRKLRTNKLVHRFNLEGAYPFIDMLKNQIKGKVDSWAIRWYASALINDKLTLYPCKSLAQNIGNDKSGTNSGITSSYDIALSSSPIHFEYRLPVEDMSAFRQFQEFHLSLRNHVFKRLTTVINYMLRKIHFLQS